MEIINTAKFIERSKSIYGNRFDYSRSIYVRRRSKVFIHCNVCGNEFWQTPSNHYKWGGCIVCGKLLMKGKTTKTREEFIQNAQEVHKYQYIYDKVNYINALTKVDIVCRKHGIFHQTPNKHLMGRGCQKCNSSKGEDAILEYLEKVNANFREQYSFKDCRNILPLRFDFAIFNQDTSLKCLIEYQGKQHYHPFSKFGGIKHFNDGQIRDEIKRNYCKSHNITLHEISYKQFNNIENILSSIL